MLLTIAMVLVMMVFVVVAGDAGGYGCRCIVAGAVGVDDDDNGKTRQSSEVASLARVRDFSVFPPQNWGVLVGQSSVVSQYSQRILGEQKEQEFPRACPVSRNKVLPGLIQPRMQPSFVMGIPYRSCCCSCTEKPCMANMAHHGVLTGSSYR